MKKISLIILFLLMGCGGKNGKTSDSNAAAKQKALSVNAIVVRSVALNQNLAVSGILLPSEEVELKAENTGKLVELHLDEGIKVAKGQLLARINDTEIRAKLSKLEVDLKLAKEEYERKAHLKEINAISQQELDVALSRVDGFKSDIQGVKAQIEKCEIRAPFDGIIGLRNVSPGAIVGTSTVLAKLVQDNPLKLDFSVSEQYAGFIEKGQKITFTIGGGEKLNEAVIYAFEPSIDPATRALKVRARVRNANHKILAGSFAQVNLNISSGGNTIMVPSLAMIPVLGAQTVVLSREGKAFFQKVETGLRTSTEVEIISGVRQNDTLLVSGLLQVKNGMALSVKIQRE